MRKTLITAALGMLASGQMALAAPTLPTLFTQFQSTSTDNPYVAGLATMQYKSSIDSTRLKLLVVNLEPNTTYGVLAGSDGPESSNPNAFTTDCFGIGVYQADFLQDATTQNPFIVIYVWDGNPDDVLGVTPDEEKAIALPLHF